MSRSRQKSAAAYFFPAMAEPITEGVKTYAGFTTGFFDLVGLAGLLLPNEPWNLFPLAVFLSPLPMLLFFE